MSDYRELSTTDKLLVAGAILTVLGLILLILTLAQPPAVSYYEYPCNDPYGPCTSTVTNNVYISNACDNPAESCMSGGILLWMILIAGPILLIVGLLKHRWGKTEKKREEAEDERLEREYGSYDEDSS